MASSVFLFPGFFQSDGTTITFPSGTSVAATRFLAGDGLVGAPSYSFTNRSTAGLWNDVANGGIAMSFGGGVIQQWDAGAIRFVLDQNLAAGAMIGWSASSAYAAPDVSIGRGAANRLDLATGDSFNVVSGQYLTGGNALNYTRTVYAVGTAYALTNTAAAIDVGTTDPAIVLDKAGTYLIYGQVNVAYNAATVTAETAAFKVRRTNNTAADLSVIVPIDLPASTVLTHTYGVIQIPPFVYTTTATDDAVTIFANVSAGLSAGTIDATAIGTSLVALRIA